MAEILEKNLNFVYLIVIQEENNFKLKASPTLQYLFNHLVAKCFYSEIQIKAQRYTHLLLNSFSILLR